MQVNLNELVMRFLPDDILGKVAASLSIDKSAMDTAVPVMVRGLLNASAKRASNLTGAREFAEVLDAQDLDRLGDLVGKIGAPDQDEAVGEGLELAEQMLDKSARNTLIADVSKEAGINRSQSEQLLGLLMTAVAGTLVEKQHEDDLDAGGLAHLLAPALESAKVLDSDAVPTLKAVASKPPEPTMAPVAVAVAAEKPLEKAPDKILDKPLATGSSVAAASAIVPAPVPIADDEAPSVVDEIPEVSKSPERRAVPGIFREGSSAAKPAPGGAVGGKQVEAARAAPKVFAKSDAASEMDVDVAPVRRRGHYIARWGWVIPLLLLAAGGAWWMTILANDSSSPIVASSPQADAQKARPAAPQTEAAQPSILTTPPPLTPPSANDTANTIANPAVPLKEPEKADAAVKMADDADAARMAVAAKAARDAELAQKAAAEAAAADAAAKVVRDAELARKAALIAEAAAAAKAVQDAERARQVEREAAAAATARAAAAAKAATTAKTDAASASAPKAAANTTAPPAAATSTDASAACVKVLNEASAANRIHFDFATDDMTRRSMPTLKQVAAALKTCPDVHVRIEGHTDTDGHWDRNERLSRNRARAVVEFLTDAGIASRRLSAVGYGQTRPRVPNDSEANKQLNRRIEFAVVTDHG